MLKPSSAKKSSATRKCASLFFKSFHEFVPVAELASLPKGMRGIYALYQKDDAGFLNLAYVGT